MEEINREHRNEYKRAWRKKNPEKVKRYSDSYRARKASWNSVPNKKYFVQEMKNVWTYTGPIID